MRLAVDPGTNSPGAALVDLKSNLIVAATAIPEPAAWVHIDPGQRWLNVARTIVQWSAQRTTLAQITEVVFERPQWYQRKKGKSKGNPNDLAGVAGVAANVSGMLSVWRPDIVVVSMTPFEWTGHVPKVCPVCNGRAKRKCRTCEGSAWKTPRGYRIRSRLSPAEIAVIPDQNDAIDAVGVALHRGGRMEQVRVFHGARAD